jgi:REP element-mobilizing transposase RayT
MRHARQLTLARTGGWGGRREGAGRKRMPGRRPAVPHRARPLHRCSFPVHLTLRARAGLPTLRGPAVFGSVREGIRQASSDLFRVVHFSVQADHVHLMVEASDTQALALGARGLAVRLARAVNRALGRQGAVWGDRYHARALRTPRDVRHGLIYVLMNFRKHRRWDRSPIDACSSAWWFDGFRSAPPTTRAQSPVCRPRTWLGSVGWRRHGLVGRWERPSSGALQGNPSTGRSPGSQAAREPDYFEKT